MHSTRRRTGIAFFGASLFVAGALAIACGSFESSPGDALDSGADAPDTNAVADVGASDADGGAPICPVGTCRIVFVTSEGFKGAFGGLQKGDIECNRLAGESAHPAVLGRTFRAWLSAPDAGAKDRHSPVLKPYVRVDGVVVANSWNQLTTVFNDAGALQAPIQIDEKGASANMDLVWTGTTYNGNPSDNTCAGWTASSGAGQVGRADRTDEAWTDTDVPLGISGDCSSQLARLYCFEE